MDLFEHLPGDVGWIDIVDPDFPFRDRQTHLLGARRGGVHVHGAGPAVDEGAGVGGILEDLQDGRGRRALPDEIAKAVSPRKAQLLLHEKLEHFAR